MGTKSQKELPVDDPHYEPAGEETVGQDWWFKRLFLLLPGELLIWLSYRQSGNH